VPVETLTFLFTDIESSTALLRRLGDGGYAQVLADHHSLIRSGLAAHGGEEVDTQGDAFFAESFDLDAAEAVCGFGDIEPVEVADLLGSLVDKSLVVAESNGGAFRYRLLETIRQFAAERLAEAGADEAAAVAAAHCEHFLSVAEAAAPHLPGPDQGTWLASLDTEQANMRRAAEHAASDPDGTSQLLRFGVALHAYWMARSRAEEELGLLAPVLERPGARTDPRLFGAALAHAALAARPVDLATALQLGNRAVEFARQLHDDRLLIESLATLCGTYYFAGEADRGLPLGEESVERARRLGDDVLLAASLAGYLLCSDLIEPTRSEQLFAEAVHQVRTSLGEEQAARAYANGMTLSLDQALDLALGRGHSA